MLPRVRELEDRFGDALVVVGVHAGKYPAERDTGRLRVACDRLGVRHPVVNDRRFRVWRSYDVRAWPTAVLVGPDGYYLGSQSGEFSVAEMSSAIERAIAGAEASPGAFSRPATDAVPLPASAGTLRYPARVLVDGMSLFISDTGNNRVLRCELDASSLAGTGPLRARVTNVWGGEAGYADGAAADARFLEPQGLAIAPGSLFVADRGSHTVRRVDLGSGEVETIAGTGEVGRWSVRSGASTRSSLRSPMALAERSGALLIAMAGSHQLWSVEVKQRTIRLYAGSGGEDISDGRQDRAALAQPMGLAYGPDGVYFVDAESSSVRVAGLLPTGTIRTLVGTGLFDHGDRDGQGPDALLQHPQDLTWHDRRLLVADTYNDKVKSLDPLTRECASLPGDAGSGKALSGPSGISSDGRLTFVADTDSHRVVMLEPGTGELREVVVD